MFYVRIIESYQTHDWLLHKHYAKRIPSISYSYGLYDDENILQGVITYGKPASPSLCIGVCGKLLSNKVYELNRVCVNEGLPKNTLSFFVSQSLKMLPPLIIVSYADVAQNHHGYIYQATNWIYTGATKERTDIGIENGTHSRHYDKKLDYKKHRKKRSSKHRYVYFTGTKRDKKIHMKHLNYKTEPYPKGENDRYECNYIPSVQTILL